MNGEKTIIDKLIKAVFMHCQIHATNIAKQCLKEHTNVKERKNVLMLCLNISSLGSLLSVDYTERVVPNSNSI